MEQPPVIITYPELDAWGYTRPDVGRALTEGLLIRLRHGAYVMADAWASAYAGARIAARAHALALVSEARPVFSHETAAALLGLALYAPDDGRVHVIVPAGRPGAAAGVVRHRGDIAASDLVEIDGLLCTNLTRTVADIARTATFEKAVTVMDAALRRVCTPAPHEYDTDAAARFLAGALVVTQQSAHGLSRAERVLQFADGRAELPGESVSRVRFAELGFAPPQLQVPVAAPGGRMYFVDFGLDDVHAFGEFDGRIKYVDGLILVSRTADDVFDDEKQREDWIRGTTDRRFARWGWPHIRTAPLLGARLAAFGIAAP